MALYDVYGNVVSAGGSVDTPVVGARVCAIGDSNTQYMGNNLETYVKKYTGIASLRNFGTAGAWWEIRDDEDISTTSNASGVGKVNQLIASADPITNKCTDYDIITIMLGTNCSVKGALSDTSANVETMCGAMRYCLEKLLYYYRGARIGGIIPPQRAEINAEQEERNELIRAIYEEYSIPYLDLYRAGQIVPDSTLPDGNGYYLSDGTHLGGNGQESVYRKYAAFISRL
jgi:lysophospholipase L1-like esterase